MNKNRAFQYGLNIIIAVILSLAVCSCSGQQNKYDESTKFLQRQAVAEGSNLNNDPSIEQISQVVRMMFQDSMGNIWFGTENGAFTLRGDSLIHIDDIKSEYGKGVTIKDISEEKDGTIWLGHTDGISSIKDGTVSNYYESDGLISNDVWSVTATSDGKIWIGTIDGLCIFKNGKFTNFELPEGEKDTTVGVSSTRMINNILEDRTGKIWISSNAGLFSYADNELTDESARLGIQTNFVNILFEDKKGGLWISTKEGLYLLEENIAKNITAGKVDLGKGIGSVAEDKDGIIWLVVNQHYLYTYDGNELTEFHKTEDNKGPVVFQIFKDRDDRLWFVGYGGAYRLENGNFLNITKTGPW